MEALHHERDQEQASFADLERELADKYGVANGKVYGLPRIQAQLPAHIAIVA